MIMRSQVKTRTTKNNSNTGNKRQKYKKQTI